MKTYIAYIATPRRANVPALKAVNRAVRASHRRLPANEWPVLGAPEPMMLRQATP